MSTSPPAPQAARLNDEQIAALPVLYFKGYTCSPRSVADAAAEQAYRAGVAETEAKMTEESGEYNIGYSKAVSEHERLLANERANGAALAAAIQECQRKGWYFPDSVKAALANFNASQGEEESHAE